MADKVRPGRGSESTVPLMIHLTAGQKKALKDAAIRRGISMSSLVREWVDELLLPDEDD